MLSARRASIFPVLSLIGLWCSAGTAHAQAWGEQAPVQFKYSNQGLAEEVYRNQLGEAAAAVASSSASGSSLGQSSNQLNNAVQLNNANTYNITITGSGDYLNVSGDTVNAQQTSTGTTQSSNNSGSGSSHTRQKGSNSYINK